ncbi:MAG: FAD-dependent oxidoreductase, partial [Rhodospirillales bacterium]|nr:FAD-dependent oxidoreductase [Rhodospirillales bacterium]
MAETRKIETDIAIIGAGGAGMAAGIEALDAGAKVIAFEMAAAPGGAAIISGGGCLIAGSPLQKENGIVDTPDLAFSDWMKCGGVAVDEVWARYYIEHTLHDLYHWAESLGVKWADVTLREDNSVARWTRADQNGFGLMTRLIEAFKARGGEILTNTKTTLIKTDGGKVTGIEAVNSETGEKTEVSAGAVVVATGGFNSNQDMIYEIRPDLKDGRIMEGSGPGSIGTGHKLVRELGGYFTHLEEIWFYVYSTPDYRHPGQKRGLAFRRVPGYIWINQQGKRFHNESLSGGRTGAPALMAQNPRHAWAIADWPMLDGMEVADPYYRTGNKIMREKVEELLENSPFIHKADTLEE